MYGILTDVGYEKHWIFKNYYYGIKNVFGEENIKRINSKDDLVGIDILFIGDEHFIPNKEIWMRDEFIDFCNLKKIKVVVFNNEKILNSFFPWNVDIQKNLQKFKNLHQFVYDVNDSEILNVGINKTFMSRDFLSIFNINKFKKNKTLFMGNYKGGSYDRRQIFLSEISKSIDIDILESNPNLKMDDYINFISSYKYILSPLGNGDFVPMRYYETLFVGSIPLQQSTNKIDKYFEREKGIFFSDINTLLEKMKDFNYVENDYFMEDFIKENVIKLL